MNTKHELKRDPNHIFVGLPQGQNAITREMRNLQAALRDMTASAQDGFPWHFTFFEAQSFSTAKARNIIVNAALKTDASKILFIDADMNAGVAQASRILSHSERVVGGMYPKKTLMSDGVAQWVVNFKKGETATIGLHECQDVGAGFLRVDMTVFEEIAASGLVKSYYSDDAGTFGEIQVEFFNENVVSHVWGPGTDPWARRVGEDFYFCWLCWRCEIPVYCDTVCQVGHIGPVDFLQVYALIQRLTSDGKANAAPHGSVPPELPRHT